MKFDGKHGKPKASILHVMKQYMPQEAEKGKPSVYINHIYAVALIVSLAFLIAGLSFIIHTTNLSREETIGYIEDATEQTRFAVDEHIQEEFDILMAAAVVARDKDLLEENAVLHDLIMGLSTHNAYAQIGFADTNGQAVWVDLYDREHRGNLSDDGFIQRALTGENSLSNVRYDKISGEDVHFFAVPVYNGAADQINGVLFAAVSQDEIREIINNSLFAGKGLAHIIDDQGNYIVESDSPLRVGIGDNIFEVRNPLSPDAQQEILDTLEARAAGHLAKSFYGENRLIAYAPLNINDWYVFYAVPENMVNAGLQSAMVGTIVYISIAAVVFALLILLIRRVNTKNRKALESLAFVDPVTGHRNFRKFLLDAGERLKNANGFQYAVCYSDIKDFKYINDMFGRDAGDRLLRYMADFLEMMSQEGEVFTRITDNSFIALRRFKTRKEIELRFASTAQHLAVFPETFSRGYKIEMYGGVYVIDAEDGDLTLNDMIDRAVTAQEYAQATSREDKLGFYSKEMREQKLWEAEVESTMEAALENGEFQVYLQPKIDIQHGTRIAGAEALVRWASPDKGLIPPGRFIDLFERNGFIVELDRYLFQKVCRFYKEHILENGLPACVLSVNVSRLGLMRPDFIKSYTSIREAHGIPDGCIELEFTESLAFEDQALFKATVAECKRNGFLCSMDDFGAGYSSLNILKSIPVDILKLDRQFFLYGDDAERGQELVRNIIAMAKSLTMKTVAEGIESEEQMVQLREMGCDVVQGYVFSRPLPAAEFIRFVEAWEDSPFCSHLE